MAWTAAGAWARSSVRVGGGCRCPDDEWASKSAAWLPSGIVEAVLCSPDGRARLKEGGGGGGFLELTCPQSPADHGKQSHKALSMIFRSGAIGKVQVLLIRPSSGRQDEVESRLFFGSYVGYFHDEGRLDEGIDVVVGVALEVQLGR